MHGNRNLTFALNTECGPVREETCGLRASYLRALLTYVGGGALSQLVIQTKVKLKFFLYYVPNKIDKLKYYVV